MASGVLHHAGNADIAIWRHANIQFTRINPLTGEEASSETAMTAPDC